MTSSIYTIYCKKTSCCRTLRTIHKVNALCYSQSDLTGGVDSIFQSSPKLNQLSPVGLDFYETLQGVSAGKYLQACRECFSIATVKVKVKIWQMFLFYKAN